MSFKDYHLNITNQQWFKPWRCFTNFCGGCVLPQAMASITPLSPLPNVNGSRDMANPRVGQYDVGVVVNEFTKAKKLLKHLGFNPYLYFIIWQFYIWNGVEPPCAPPPKVCMVGHSHLIVPILTLPILPRTTTSTGWMTHPICMHVGLHGVWRWSIPIDASTQIGWVLGWYSISQYMKKNCSRINYYKDDGLLVLVFWPLKVDFRYPNISEWYNWILLFTLSDQGPMLTT